MDDSPDSANILSLLTRDELAQVLAASGLVVSNFARRSKARLVSAILVAEDASVRERAFEAVERKVAARLDRRGEAQRRRATRRRETGDRVRERRQQEAGANEPSSGDPTRFLQLPSDEQAKECIREFLAATSADKLEEKICGVCAQRLRVNTHGFQELRLSAIPNIHRLKPRTPHPGHDLVSGYLLERAACRFLDDTEVEVSVCWRCRASLTAAGNDCPPMLSLANGLWIGSVPLQLQVLTLPEQLLIARLYPRVYVMKLFPKDRRGGFDPSCLQSALKGNVTTFELNTERVVAMVEGQLMPQPGVVLSKVLSVTYVDAGPLPKKWLRSTFRVRRHYVREALVWLQTHNRYYANIHIDHDRLEALPEDNIPDDILATMRQETDTAIIDIENDTYVPRDTMEVNDALGMDIDVPQEENVYAVDQGETLVIFYDSNTQLFHCQSLRLLDEERAPEVAHNELPADVVPLQYLGVMDTDLSNVTSSQLMMWGLANLWSSGKEGGYAVQHGSRPVADFGMSRRDLDSTLR